LLSPRAVAGSRLRVKAGADGRGELVAGDTAMIRSRLPVHTDT